MTKTHSQKIIGLITVIERVIINLYLLYITFSASQIQVDFYFLSRDLEEEGDGRYKYFNIPTLISVLCSFGSDGRVQ